jgi:hypothetical protein
MNLEGFMGEGKSAQTNLVLDVKERNLRALRGIYTVWLCRSETVSLCGFLTETSINVRQVALIQMKKTFGTGTD